MSMRPELGGSRLERSQLHGRHLRRLSSLQLGLVLLLASLALVAPVAESVEGSAGATTWSSDLRAAPTLGPSGRPIGEFPGQARLPRRDDPLVRDLVITSAIYAERPTMQGSVPFYQVLMGQPGPEPTLVARFFGARGAALYPTFGGGPPRPEGCSDSVAYCATSQLGDPSQPTLETFFDLSNSFGVSARVSHSLLPSGQSWSVILYDRQADLTYGFTLHDAAAAAIGANGLGAANLALAQSLVERAAGFEAVPLGG
jgi:hypothetical protein